MESKIRKATCETASKMSRHAGRQKSGSLVDNEILHATFSITHERNLVSFVGWFFRRVRKLDQTCL